MCKFLDQHFWTKRRLSYNFSSAPCLLVGAGEVIVSTPATSPLLKRLCFFALADEPSQMDAEQSTQTARDETSLTQTSTTTQPDAQSKPVAMATAAEPTTHTVSVPLPPPVEDVKNKKGEIFCTRVKYIYTIYLKQNVYTLCFKKTGTLFIFFIIHSNDDQFTRNFYQM